jgi:hypothetical protein
MSISTYFRPSIHQNGPEILGVKFINTTQSLKEGTRCEINGPLASKGVLKGAYSFLSRELNTPFYYIIFKNVQFQWGYLLV